MISAVYSRFSGVLSGGSVWTEMHMFKCKELAFSSQIEWVGELCPHQQEVVVFRFCPQILEDDLLHEPFHQVPVLNDAVTDRPLDRNAKRTFSIFKIGKDNIEVSTFVAYEGLSMASSPMKKSRSSTPLIILRWA